MNSRMQHDFILNNSGINEYIKIDDRGAVIQRLFVYEEGGGGGGGGGSSGGGRGEGGGRGGGRGEGGGRGGGGGGLPELLPEVHRSVYGSGGGLPQLLRPGGRRTRKNKNRK